MIKLTDNPELLAAAWEAFQKGVYTSKYGDKFMGMKAALVCIEQWIEKQEKPSE